jgi:hypothetical protein
MSDAVPMAPIFGASPETPSRTSEYEFSAEDNQTFQALGRAMAFVGTGCLVGGVLLLVVALGSLWWSGTSGVLPSIVQSSLGGAFLVTGQWLRGASVSILAIATTEGRDVAHLMAAMRGLQRMFTLQRGLMIAFGAVVLPLMLVASAVLTFFGARLLRS